MAKKTISWPLATAPGSKDHDTLKSESGLYRLHVGEASERHPFERLREALLRHHQPRQLHPAEKSRRKAG